MMWPFLLTIFYLRDVKATVITSPPQDATTLFGDTAVFNCTGEGDLLQWTYDGDTVDGQIAQQHQISIIHRDVLDGMVSSSLYINATIENDEQSIGCVVVSNTPFDVVSKGAMLTVIRIGTVLLPIAVLVMPSDNGNGDNSNVTEILRITWCTPSILSPDIDTLQYETTIQTDNTSTTITTTDTYIILYNIQYCVLYNITITAFGTDNTESKPTHFSDSFLLQKFTGSMSIARSPL